MRKRGIIIDLTSLLDVILIMLFMVIQNAGGQAAIYKQKAADAATTAQEAEERAASAEKAADRALSALSSYEALDENSVVVTISAGGSSGSRALTVGESTADGIKNERSVASSPGSEIYMKNSLAADVNDIIRGDTKAKIAFVVFTYNADAVYKYEYDLIHGYLAEIAERDNVYTAEYNR